MWNVDGVLIESSWLNPEPIRVLYEFEGPRIFTCKDTKGDLFLAFQCGEENGILRFLVVPFSQTLEDDLTSGAINLREALSRSHSWIFDLGMDWQIQRAWRVDLRAIPPTVLPRHGVMLWRHLQPVMKRWSPSSASSETEVKLETQPNEPRIMILAGAS